MHTEEIKSIIREFLERLTVAVEDVSVREEENPPLFHVTTKDSGVLIGINGDNLRALNVVVKKIVERRLGAEAAAQFFLDVNGYQSRHIAEVRSKVRMLAERARTFKYDVEMSPMNAYERMIVHATFTNDPDIATESVGEGKFRRVVLKYMPNKQPATHNSQPLERDIELFGTV
ncbi:hypothetical protein A2761_02550 [Candidatus Kaiserbacteria bacterium RIFCSPHIGHO2_01_FULL_51_33]|uniref:R3H domain-containing protein n=1 Tax=Candidatus Kaiserbacteria bacterium RIFCSPLOWO2_01_FULL_51_21 TaxID=1798508 RepID=A0A1F6EDB6_9BACT|nr:MAG: hypothetical protein A2761_02550 [Candidatus Kaiserbacteria bacterium RIFCSPHIGHO2_01_FULL_51_33]OGG71659.1 MAG: hypothetical protein A3A35_00640 [Candidatus Kaiserbacteria bacterium RIFCSPLOWO2_01_FULL_51_21]